MPSDRPQDVYMEVANLVEKTRVKDAADGLSIAQLLEGTKLLSCFVNLPVF